MQLHLDQLRSATPLNWLNDAGGAPPRLLRGGARGAHLRCTPGQTSLWLCLRGELELESADCSHRLRPGEARVLPAEERIRAGSRSPSLWLAISGDGEFWRTLLQRPGPLWTQVDTLPVPDWWPASRGLRRALVRLARAASGGATPAQQRLCAETLGDTLVDDQSVLLSRVSRCPGRTPQARRQVFARLLRVRNRLLLGSPRDLDVEEMARLSSYSPCHFIRVFHHVFDVTPHELLIQARMRTALDLLREGHAVAEVSRAVGIDNRCVFSRLVRQRLGRSPTELRRPLRA